MRKRTLVIVVAMVMLSAAVTSAIVAGNYGQRSNNQTNDNTSSSTITLGATATKHVYVYYFYSSVCPHCKAVAPYITSVCAKYPQVTLLKYQVNGNSNNWALYQSFMKKYHATPNQVPAVFVGSHFMIGETAIKAHLQSYIVAALK